MAIYELNGQRYELPDDIRPDDALSLIQGSSGSPSQNQSKAGQAVGAQAPAATAQVDANKIDPATLSANKDWVAASRIMYEAANPRNDTMSDSDYAEYGLDQMGWFNYNTIAMGVDAAKLASASDQEKKAFLYLMNTYDNLEMSWGGVGRFIKGQAADPLNYTGLASLGLGTAANQATKLASKEALKGMLKSAIVAGVDNAIVSGVQSTIRQEAEINAGGREGFDVGSIAKDTAIGLGAGALFGGAVDAGATVFRGAVKGAGKAVEAAPTPSGTTLAEATPTPAGEAPRGLPEAPKAEPSAEAPRVEPEVARPVEPSVRPEEPPVRVEPPVEPSAVPEPAHTASSLDEAVATIAKSEPGIETNPVLKAIKEAAGDEGGRFMPRGEARVEAAASAVDELLKLKPENVQPLVEQVRRAALNPEGGDLVAQAAMDATEKLLTRINEVASDSAADAVGKNTELDKLYKLLDVIRGMDLDVSSNQGSGLAARVGKVNTGAFREVSPESILQAQGIDPAFATPNQLAEARNAFQEKLANHLDIIKKEPEVQKIEQQIIEAQRAGDFTTAAKLTDERAALVEHIADLKAQMDGTAGFSVKGGFNKVTNAINEVAISNVFTPKTVVMNTVPSLAKILYRPLLDAVVTGGDTTAFRIAGAQYMAMAQSIDFGLRGFAAAFRYEKGLLANDFVKYMEHDPVWKKMYGGGLVRIFPRILNATDEMFQQIAYRGFVASQATAKAIETGAQLGLKGADLDLHVKNMVRMYSEHAFEKDIGIGALDMLRKEGLSRGYRGEKLHEWMKLELDKNGDLFRTATSESGLRYTKDLLFKREFSGTDEASKIAQWYEKFVNDVPAMRLIGQLFFRTPVRVFEEGFRLTPGLNLVSGLVAGQFLRDLRGANGPLAMARAQGEAMLSLAIGAMVIERYASGNLTGAGSYDWKQRRTMEAAGFKPYTLKVNGHEMNFRNLDPFATPLKVMANVLENLTKRNYKEAQGEYENKGAWGEAASYASVAGLAILNAVKDANLMDGLSQAVTLAGDLADPEAKQDAIWKFLGQKAAMAIPTTISRVENIGNPVMNDPVAAEQFIRSKLNPADPKVPKRYDPLGNVVKDDNPLGTFTGIDIMKPLPKNASKADKVNYELAKIAIQSDGNFQAPYKVNYIEQMKGLDLRTQPAKDGRSLYDHWQEKVNQSKLTDTLYNILVKGSQNLPQSVRKQLAQEQINNFRQQAFMDVMKEETGSYRFYRDSEVNKAFKEAGKKDVKQTPFFP